MPKGKSNSPGKGEGRRHDPRDARMVNEALLGKAGGRSRINDLANARIFVDMALRIPSPEEKLRQLNALYHMPSDEKIRKFIQDAIIKELADQGRKSKLREIAKRN